ncbi:MAG: hypothetical protein J6X39_00325 [Bacteroidales bacterium]|nr:hypothetical protein [Bacteroidales bacterium]
MIGLGIEAWSEPRITNFNSSDGLPSNTVYAIVQDGEGLLWIGTRGGLCRFDGTRFESWREYGRVNALSVDKENRIWIGTAEGLAVRCPVGAGHDKQGTGHDKQGTGHDKQGIGHDKQGIGHDKQGIGHDIQVGNVRALLTDSDGTVWATVGDTLLLKLSWNEGIKIENHCFYNKRDSEGDYPYYQIYEASDGKLWMGGRIVRTQYLEDRQNPRTITLYGSSGFCTGSYAEAEGKLYAFDDHTSLLYTIDEGIAAAHGRLPIAHARLLTAHDGHMWAAGSYGLGIVDLEKPENTQVYKTASQELFCIFEDRHGNIWVGGDSGLSVVSPSLNLVRRISDGNVTALMQDSHGKMWIGTAEERVSSLYEDSEGTVYVGLWNNTGFEVWKNGRMHKERLSGAAPRLQREAAVESLDGANWISDFLEDSRGRFWVVTWEGVGLNEWDRKAGKALPPRWLSPFRYPSPQVDSNIYVSSRLGSALIEDSKGNLVYGTTQAGLNIIDAKTGLVTKYYRANSSIPDDYVTDLCLGQDGTVWAATRSGLWSPSGTHLLDGLLVQSVITDRKGRLWAGTEEGLYFVDTDGSIGVARKGLGFPSDIYAERAACALADGSLAFGGPEGAAVFNPDSLLALQAAGNLLLEPLAGHRYRLNGGEWVEGRFTGLPENVKPGRYSLEEQSSDIFGRWDRGASSVSVIRIPQPLWLRWPFLLAYLLVVAALVWIVIRLRERRLLVKQLDTRNRFFSIISHDLRNPVSGNSMLAHQMLDQVETLEPAQIKEGLEALAASADKASSLLENLLLWSLSQKGMLEPVLRDEDMADLAAEAVYSVRKNEIIELDIPAGLRVQTDRNMLLTCLRNLLDNAVKASPEGGKVVLSAEGRRITITDQGPGMKEGATGWGHGLGLVITRELLEKMGAKMTALNRPEGGLEITITL